MCLWKTIKPTQLDILLLVKKSISKIGTYLQIV